MYFMLISFIKMANKLHYSTIFILFSLLAFDCNGKLVINIRNGGGEVFQEIISSNATENTVEIEYQNTDGSLITHMIDFQNVSLLFYHLKIVFMGITLDLMKF